MPKSRLVMVGNGMAAARALQEILARGGRDLFDISVFAEEPSGPYDRMRLADVMAGLEDPEELAGDIGWYLENGVTLHLGEGAKLVSRETKRVYGSRGTIAKYDKLILATGSDVYLPPIRDMLAAHGGLRDRVFAFRTLEDCRNIAAHARHAKRVVVLGGGVAALEAVRGLHGLCPDVHLVHRGSGLMRSQLGPAGAAALQVRVEALGVTVHLNKTATRVLDASSLRRVAFSDGSSLECDLLVVAMGIHPATWLAYQSGLTVTRAVVVDSQLRSVDDPTVYSLGECAEHRGQVEALAESIREQARVLAAHITGTDPHVVFSPRRSVSSIPLFGIEAAWIGTTDAELPSDQVTQVTEPELGGFYRLVLREGRLIGAIGLGKAGRLEELSRTVTQRVAS